MDLEKKKREREERERDLGLLLGASTGYSFLVLLSILLYYVGANLSLFWNPEFPLCRREKRLFP